MLKDHSTFKTDTASNVTKYAELTPNSQNPKGFDLVKRVEVVGGSHTNKITLLDIYTLHVHGSIAPGSSIPGGVRLADIWEIPKRR